MRDVVWHALAAVGLQRDDPATWSTERPTRLQHLKPDPVFRAAGSALTLSAIDEVLGDVIRMHPLLLHAPPATHLGSSPRFLLNKDIAL